MKKIFTVLFFLSGLVWGQIQNPGFEDGTAHWTGDSHLTISEETTIVHGGSKSLNCTFDSQTQSQCDLRNDFVEGITAGNSYTLTAWFYDNDAAGRGRLVMEWYDASDNFISNSWGPNYTTDQTDWQQLSMTATAPTDAAKVKVGARFYDVNSNWDGDCTIYVDDFDGTPPLPVELTTFSASIVNNKVELNWETATEVNNFGFNVERRPETGNWNKVGFVEGYGNSYSPKHYTFTDSKVSTGKYFYRLKQIDIDGSFEYSDEVEVHLGTPSEFELSQNYPNPFNPTTNIQFSIPKASKVKLVVFNVIGEQVAELVNKNMEAGYHNVQFNAGNLNSGIYIYKLETDGFVKIRKMMLVK